MIVVRNVLNAIQTGRGIQRTTHASLLEALEDLLVARGTLLVADIFCLGVQIAELEFFGGGKGSGLAGFPFLRIAGRQCECQEG